MSPFQGLNDSRIDSQGFALGYIMLPLWGKRLTTICLNTDATMSDLSLEEVRHSIELRGVCETFENIRVAYSVQRQFDNDGRAFVLTFTFSPDRSAV